MKTIINRLLAALAVSFALLAFSQPAHALIRSAAAIHLCWDIKGGTVAPGAEVILWDCHNRPNQRIWLDFSQGEAWKGSDVLGSTDWRTARLRIQADGDHCINPENMQVGKMPACGFFETVHLGDKKYLIRARNMCAKTKYWHGWANVLMPYQRGEGMLMERCWGADGAQLQFQHWLVEQ